MSRTFMEIMTDLDNIKEELDEKIFNEVVAKPKTSEWIPVTERLPDDMTYVLTTIHIPDREPVVRSGFYENGLFHNDNGNVWKATDKEVLAWLPLPEPYKEQTERSK